MRNKNGFTLMELIIVLAILAIIAAILIPTFLNTTDRARLRSDIQSAHVIQNAMDLYRAERGVPVPGSVATGGNAINMNTVLTNLYNAGFLPQMVDTDTQTAGIFAIRRIPNSNPASYRVMVDISNIDPDDNIHRIANNLPENERRYIHPPLVP